MRTQNRNKNSGWDFPDGLVVKSPPWNAKDAGLIPDQRTNPTCLRATGPTHHAWRVHPKERSQVPPTKTRYSRIVFFLNLW